MWYKYKNGNYLVRINSVDGTKIRETMDDEFQPRFAENIDVKISNRCDMGCPFCHEGCTEGGAVPPLNQAFWNSLHPYQELAIGGGNVFSNPDLVPLLRKLKQKRVLPSITVHQEHFHRNFSLIKKLQNEKMLYGVGVSVAGSLTSGIIDEIKEIPTAVLHVINGIFDDKILAKIAGKGLKLLILGYKEIRRGSEYLQNREVKDSTLKKQKWLKANIEEILDCFEVVSFDNLAIEQLGIREILSAEEWERFYMGDEGMFTFYIDAVENKFAESSTADMEGSFLYNASVGRTRKGG